MRILIVGQRSGTHIGGSFARAAERLGHQVNFADATQAYRGSGIVAKLAWHLAGKRPVRLGRFGKDVVSLARQHGSMCVIATGIAPIDADCIGRLVRDGIPVLSYLTDDPWNPAHRAAWFFEALRCYSGVFTPRRANISDISALGIRRVSYLPFGYDEDLFYPDHAGTLASGQSAASEVAFAGGADEGRVPYMTALLKAKINLALYGGFWDRYPATRGRSRGLADVQVLRRILSSAKIGLCLVRRQNRDGNCMRTFEVPAVGACMLAEDTAEHRELFGADGEAVAYFGSPDDMVDRAIRLIRDDGERGRLAMAAHRIVTTQGHSYRDRLRVILDALLSL